MVKKNMTMLLKTILLAAGLSLSLVGWDVLAATGQMGTPNEGVENKPLRQPQENMFRGSPNPNVRIAPPAKPDLIVTIGSGMPPYFVVCNIGKGSAGASVLKIDCIQAGSAAPGRKCIAVFRNYGPTQIPVWKNIPAFALGALHTINLESVDPLLYPFDDKYTFRAEADTRRQVAEKNESNNKDIRVVDKR